MTDEIKLNEPSLVELNQFEHPAWDEPIVCRVEVDLPGWLTQLTGKKGWEVYSEDEEETCISFTMRNKPAHGLHGDLSDDKTSTAKTLAGETNKQMNEKLSKEISAKNMVAKDIMAEVTLYHNGYAVVDIEGEAVFDGALTSATSQCAKLSYYHINGDQITLN